MKKLFVGFTAVILLALPAHGKDLVEGQVIGDQSLSVPIKSLVEARIAEKKVEGSSKASNAEVALEFTLKVEGNLCGSNADDVSVALTRADDKPKNLRLSLLRLLRNPEPYNPATKFCLAYSAPRTVKAVVSANSFVFGNEVDRITYWVGTGETAKKVILTHSVQNGLQLAIE